MATPDGLIQLGGTPRVRTYLREIWGRRDYMIAVPQGDLRAEHMNTMLGNLWHLLNPLLLIGVYFLVFGVILRTDQGIDNFIAFLAVGVFTFQFTQNSLQRGSGAITLNDGLIRSVYFPRAILPTAIVVEQVLLLLPTMVVTLVIALATGQRPLFGWLLLPCIYALQTAFNLGGAFIAARITDRFLDFQKALPYVFRIVFYLSGIIFSVDAFIDDELVRNLFLLNPVYVYVSMARNAVLAEPVSTALVLSGIAWAVVVLVAGFLYFRAAESRYGRG